MRSEGLSNDNMYHEDSHSPESNISIDNAESDAKDGWSWWYTVIPPEWWSMTIQTWMRSEGLSNDNMYHEDSHSPESNISIDNAESDAKDGWSWWYTVIPPEWWSMTIQTWMRSEGLSNDNMYHEHSRALSRKEHSCKHIDQERCLELFCKEDLHQQVMILWSSRQLKTLHVNVQGRDGDNNLMRLKTLKLHESPNPTGECAGKGAKFRQTKSSVMETAPNFCKLIHISQLYDRMWGPELGLWGYSSSRSPYVFLCVATYTPRTCM